VIYVMSAIFLNYQKCGVQNVIKAYVYIALSITVYRNPPETIASYLFLNIKIILWIFSIISPISCSVSSNLYDVFTFLTIFSRTVKSL
jgi:hypothetical protein